MLFAFAPILCYGMAGNLVKQAKGGKNMKILKKITFIIAVTVFFSYCQNLSAAANNCCPKTVVKKKQVTSASCCKDKKVFINKQRIMFNQHIYALKALNKLHDAQQQLFIKNAPKSKKNKKSSGDEYELEDLEDMLLEYAPIWKNIPHFPFAAEMHDMPKLLKDLQLGTIKYKKTKGKPYSEILETIQSQQKKFLNYHFKKQKKKIQKNQAKSNTVAAVKK